MIDSDQQPVTSGFVVALPVFLEEQLSWSFYGIGGFLAAWVIGYGGVQSIAPRLIGAAPGTAGDDISSARRWALVLAVVATVIAVLVAADVALTTVVLGGLIVFGIAFAVNSSLHLSSVLYLWGGRPVARWGAAAFVGITWLLTLRLPAVSASTAVTGGDRQTT